MTRMQCWFVLVCLAVASTSFATDLVVGPPGSGAAYSTVQAAVAAALPNDRILILPGTYVGAVFVDKALEIIGSGAGATILRSQATTSPGVIAPPFVVANLAAGERIRVSGLTMAIQGLSLAPLPFLMQVRNCLGRVELCDLTMNATGLPKVPVGMAAGALSIQDCSVVVGSHLVTSAVETVFPIPIGGSAAQADGVAGLIVERSGVTLDDASLGGTATTIPVSAFGGDGGPGIVAIDSVVQLGRSSVRGGPSGGRQPGVAGIGGAGIRAVRSQLLVHGGPNNLVRGAAGFEYGSPGAASLGTPAPAIALDGASSMSHASDAALIGGAGTANQPAAAAIAAAPGATTFPIASRLPTVAMTPATVLMGGLLTVEIAGEPLVDHIRVLTLVTSAAVTFPGVSGALLIDPAAAIVIHVDPLDASGVGTVPLPVPVVPALNGIQLVEQAAQVLPSGLALSPPVLATVVL